MKCVLTVKESGILALKMASLCVSRTAVEQHTRRYDTSAYLGRRRERNYSMQCVLADIVDISATSEAPCANWSSVEHPISLSKQY